MHDNPIHTFFQVLGGNIPDQLSLGGFRWFEVVLYWVLLIGSLAIGYTNWRLDSTQRTGTHLSIYAMRLVSAGMCWLFALVLQPLHGRLDTDPVPSHAIHLSDFRTTITGVLAVRELRALSFACFAFNGLQSVFISYFVTWLTALGYDLVAAGALLPRLTSRRCANWLPLQVGSRSSTTSPQRPADSGTVCRQNWKA